MRGHIDVDTRDVQQFCGLVVVSPQPGTDAGYEFLGLERLHDVVVSTGLQAQHHIHGVGLGGEHDDWHPGVGAQHAAYVDAVHPRQHEVQQDQVGAQLPDGGERLGAIAHDRGLEALPAQHDGEHLRQ
ncbi:Uncharacterised protein [Mycobacteroides abscessus subsp. massiliense]|nr:Uncharacterised protein [Mycobacteroides abscessus subsp. massiliense]